MAKPMRYKTKVLIVYWAVMGPLMLAGAARLASDLISDPRGTLRSLVIWTVGYFATAVSVDRMFRRPSMRGMNPEEEDVAYAERVSGTAMGMQLIAGFSAVAAYYVAVSHLLSGTGWDRRTGGVGIFCILLFLLQYPIRRHANRHIPSFRPGGDTLLFITLASCFAQIAAAPTAVIALLIQIGQLGSGHGWNVGLATTAGAAVFICFGMGWWRHWAKNCFAPPEPVRIDA